MGSLLLKMIIEQLNQYLRSVMGIQASESTIAVLGNIATSVFAGGNETELDNNVVVSLVNIAEEASLKNNINHIQINQQRYQSNPILHVNLYLLFTANFKEYDKAINHLFGVMEFFQGRKIFKFKNAPISSISANEIDKIGEIELLAEIHTLSFEQLNDLWGSLGGKQMPFVLYRLRLVPIEMQQPQSREGLITEIDLSTSLHTTSN